MPELRQNQQQLVDLRERARTTNQALNERKAELKESQAQVDSLRNQFATHLSRPFLAGVLTPRQMQAPPSTLDLGSIPVSKARVRTISETGSAPVLVERKLATQELAAALTFMGQIEKGISNSDFKWHCATGLTQEMY